MNRVMTEGLHTPTGYSGASKESLAAYFKICEILVDNGFRQNEKGDMMRRSTGCFFPVETLLSYETVVDFQLDWPYA